MALAAARITILYILANLAVRIMGKRQIGELQPSELVVTILLSEIASLPMQDPHMPILNSVIAVMLLVSFELISSVVTMKSKKIRTFLEGSPIMVIKNGRIDEKELKKLRFTVDDLLSALRQKDIFDISLVDYAVIETNGNLSVLLKGRELPVTASLLNLDAKDSFPCLLICDGKVISDYFSECGMTQEKLSSLLKKDNLKAEDILIMMADRNGKTVVVKKEKII